MTDSHDTAGMNRRNVLKTIGAGAVATTGAVASSGSAAAASFSNPLYEPHFPDPTIHQDSDGTWWAYGTNMNRDCDCDELLVPILSSPDLVDWTYEGEAFDSRPGWTDGSIWAPDIHYYDGEWVMFYSLEPRPNWNAGEFGIGLAKSDTPDGPFTDYGQIIGDDDHDGVGTIDGYFVEYDNTPYLWWGSFDGIHVMELTSDLQDWKPGTLQQIAGDAYEGTIHFQRNGYHYLILSTGGCCDGLPSTYELEVGRSTDFFGPYYNQNGTDLMDRNTSNKGVPILTGNRRFPGPGHGDVTTYDDGTDWLVYHAYDKEDGGWIDGVPRRVFFMDRLQWDSNDWPIVGCDGTPSQSSPAPGDSYSCSAPYSGPISEGRYYITNVNSGKYLEVAFAGTDNGDNVRQYSDTGCTCQQWDLTQNRDGTYNIRNVNSGLRMEVVDADYSEGATVQQYERTGHPCQRWRIIENSDGTYRIEAEHSAFVATVENASTDDGANVLQSGWSGGDHQKWTFTSI